MTDFDASIDRSPGLAALDELPGLGLWGLRNLVGRSVHGWLVYERPTMLFDPRRVKDSSFGAFSYVNGHGSTAIYACRVGRYCSIGEDSVIGAPEHPGDWLSSHPFAFSSPAHLPRFAEVPEYRRLAAEPGMPQRYPMAEVTTLGHDVWVGAGAFIKRGVTVGHGAIVAAHAVVTHDVPPYAIVLGAPAHVHRLRFEPAIVARLLALNWWHYDLAPHKRGIDYANIAAALETLEALRDRGALLPLNPETRRLVRDGDRFRVEPPLPPLY